jgi:hypothetical protein
MVRQDHQERTLLADEERRSTVTEPFARLRQAEADLADPTQHLLPFGCGDDAAIVAQVKRRATPAADRVRA